MFVVSKLNSTPQKLNTITQSTFKTKKLNSVHKKLIKHVNKSFKISFFLKLKLSPSLKKFRNSNRQLLNTNSLNQMLYDSRISHKLKKHLNTKTLKWPRYWRKLKNSNNATSVQVKTVNNYHNFSSLMFRKNIYSSTSQAQQNLLIPISSKSSNLEVHDYFNLKILTTLFLSKCTRTTITVAYEAYFRSGKDYINNILSSKSNSMQKLQILKYKNLPIFHSFDGFNLTAQSVAINLTNNKFSPLNLTSKKNKEIDKDLFIKTLSYFTSEKPFVNTTQKKSGKILRVLSKAAFHKMDDYSPVTADQFRGNFYKRLLIVNTQKSLNPISSKFKVLNPLLNLSYNLFLNKNSLNISVQNKFNKNLNWTHSLEMSKVNFRSYFVKKINVDKNQYASNFHNTLKLLVQRIQKKHALTPKQLFKKKLLLSSSLYLVNFKYRSNSRNFKDRRIFRNRKSKKQVLRKKARNSISGIKFSKALRKFKKKTSPLYKNFKRKIQKKINYEFVVNIMTWKLSKKKNIRNNLLRIPKKRRNVLKQVLNQQNIKHYSPLLFHTLKKRSRVKALSEIITKSTNYIDSKINFNSHVTTSRLHSALSIRYLDITTSNKLLLKSILATPMFKKQSIIQSLTTSLSAKNYLNLNLNTNIAPHPSFTKSLNKKVLNSFTNKAFNENLIPWYQHTFVRFIEDCTGKKILLQYYPFLSQTVDAKAFTRYKMWLPRMAFYERKLGHRFFLEEALHLMHLSFTLRDPKILMSWLKAMILRISFWKTRSIFRFIKYLFHNYFRYTFADLDVKGLKIKLKGKISAAGNSRKRTILYRVGKTSHSTTSIRVVNENTIISTFTGVMGLSIWIFY